MAVKFGQSLPTTGERATPENLRAVSQRAEDLGFDSLWVSDHLVIPHKIGSNYPYTHDGATPFSPTGTYFDSIGALTFVAGCTQRIRLCTNCLILPYRNPVIAAKQLSTLDVLSGGRLILGLGVGWMKEEFEYLGLDTYEQRGAVTDEYIQLYQELWTKEDPEFQGKYYQVSGAGFYPKPLQKPYPPFWVGGHSGPAMRRAAKYCDGWVPLGARPTPTSGGRTILEPDEMATRVARMRTLTSQAGRPEDAVEIIFCGAVAFDESASGPDRARLVGGNEQVADDLRKYRDAGVQHFLLGFSSQSVPELQEKMERFSRDVMPLVQQS